VHNFYIATVDCSYTFWLH